MSSKPPIYQFEGFRLDPRRRQLTGADGAPVALTGKAFDVLAYLASRAGELVTRAELFDALWPKLVVEENTLNQAVSVARRALGDERGGKRYIATVPGRGYQFVAEVRAIEPPLESVLAPAAQTRPSPAQPSEAAPAVRPPRAGHPSVYVAAVIVVVVALSILVGQFRGSPDTAGATVEAVPSLTAVAVLPFANETGSESNVYLTEGLAQEVRDALMTVPGLAVQARASSGGTRGAPPFEPNELRDLAKRLQVGALVAGSVVREAASVRVVVELIDGQTGRLLAAPLSYERSVGELPAIARAIAREIADELVPGAEPSRTTAASERSAQELIWLGQRLEADVRGEVVVDTDKLEQAIVYYRRAVEADPKSVAAHVRLASALVYRGDTDAAAEHIATALRLDPSSSEAYHVRASYYVLTLQPGAAEDYAQAIALNQSNADAIGDYALWLWGKGDVDEAAQYFERALALDRLSLSRYLPFAEYLGAKGDRERTLELAAEIGRLWDDVHGYLALARVYELVGDLDVGIAWAHRAYAADPLHPDTAGQLAELYARLGDLPSAARYEPEPGLGQLFFRRDYERLAEDAEIKLFDQDPSVPQLLAFAYNATGRFGDTLRVLQGMGWPAVARPDIHTTQTLQALMPYIDALHATGGDSAEIARLAGWVIEIMQNKIDTGMRTSWWANVYLACALADVGRDAEAIAALERIQLGVGLVWMPVLEDSHCFARFRGQPRYDAVTAHERQRLEQLRDRLPQTLRAHGVETLARTPE